MSSRNVYLSPQQRQIAPVLYQALTKAKQHFQKQVQLQLAHTKPFLPVSDVLSIATSVVHEVPEIQLDYLNIVDMNTGMDLLPTDNLLDAHTATPKALVDEHVLEEGAWMLSGAIFVGKTRLIDNIVLSQ